MYLAAAALRSPSTALSTALSTFQVYRSTRPHGLAIDGEALLQYAVHRIVRLGTEQHVLSLHTAAIVAKPCRRIAMCQNMARSATLAHVAATAGLQ